MQDGAPDGSPVRPIGSLGRAHCLIRLPYVCPFADGIVILADLFVRLFFSGLLFPVRSLTPSIALSIIGIMALKCFVFPHCDLSYPVYYLSGSIKVISSRDIPMICISISHCPADGRADSCVVVGRNVPHGETRRIACFLT